jgi:hypothetical protein
MTVYYKPHNSSKRVGILSPFLSNFGLLPQVVMVYLGIEFLELELNSNSIYKFRGKKMCLGVEFLN